MGARSLQGDDDNVHFTSDALLKLLVAIRGSSIPDKERIALRDLVLAYAQANEPEAKRAADVKLREALRRHEAELGPALPQAGTDGVAKVAASAVPEEKLPISNSPQVRGDTVRRARRVPRFSIAAAREAAKPNVETPVSTPEPKIAAAPPRPPKRETMIPIRVRKAEPEAPRNAPPPEQKPQIEAQVAAASKPEPKEPAAPATSHGDPKARIAEIKRAVNERVGNPVNLIQQNREVGQEYMAALLDAMKRSNSGGGVGAAMSRLEKAYVAAVQAIDRGPKEENVPPVPQKPKPTPAPVQTAKPQADVVPGSMPRNERPAPMPRVAQNTSIPIRSIPPPPRPASHAETRTAVEDTMADNAARKPMPAAPRKLVSLADLRSDTVRLKSVAPQERSEMPSATRAAAPQPVLPRKQPQTPPHQTKGRESDPAIFSSKVDAGLAQLLSEWKLFKSSGLFGTGPHGIDHPLYKKLAQLPMAAVVAGRFEGATPEIRQNIADYMNGWRYEHGLVHRMDEQFEQYLRRVISHILENQNDAKSETDGAPKATMVP